VRVVPCSIALICMLVAVNGCQLFNKKSDDGPFLGAKNKDKSTETKPADPLAGGAGGVTELDGVIAGRVIDGVGQPADAQIRWVCLDAAKQPESPILVAVNAQGYFMIQGLQSGKRYKLTTLAKSGDKTLEVVTMTQAPNVHLLIHVNERFAVPPAPEKGKKAAGNVKEQPASVQIQAPGGAWQDPNPAMLPPVQTFGDKTRIADLQGAVAIKAPLADFKGQGLAGATIGSPLQQPTVPVPSSIKVGARLENFALYDLNLQPWEMKKQRYGKLLLVDFWKTSCPPCLQEIPTLKMLNDQFGPRGLEIVGIAYEDAGTPLRQAQWVAAVAQQRGATYQILLGGGVGCPLKRDLDVRAYPTLVLLDETGAVVWRHEGALQGGDIADLEFAIKRRLSPD
jgi:thiol-disulfide isomerase/thioredoxin